jgi:hypothetical protein
METVEEVEVFRERFRDLYEDEIYNQTVTLCKKHHEGLHKVYGKNPSLGTAKKQPRWVQKQRDKHVQKL